MENTIIQNVFSEVNRALRSIYRKRKRALFFQKVMYSISGIYLLIVLSNTARAYFPDFEYDFLAFLSQLQPESIQNSPYASMFPYALLALLMYPTVLLFRYTFKKLKAKQEETVAKMIKMLFPKVDFAQNVVAPAREITKSKLFSGIDTDSIMYNYGQLRSKVNNMTVNIADVGIVEKNASSWLMDIPVINMIVVLYQHSLKNIFTNKSADNLHYTFRGMFCWLNYPKKLQGHTVIVTNNQMTKLNRLANFKFKEEQKIRLEDPRFTDQFLVYSTDQVEARYVLSTAIMERIVELKEKFNQPILLSFQNHQMYLAVKNENGLFSFPAGKLDSPKIIEELAHDIETALQVAEALKLRPANNT